MIRATERMRVSGVDQQYRDVLADFGQVIDFDISGLDRTGVPVTSCSLSVAGRLVHHGNGYGTTGEAAEISGLGELAEGVLSAAYLDTLRRSARTGSRAALVASLGASSVVDPRQLCLPAGADYTDDRPLTWVSIIRVGEQADVWVPIEFVASEPGELDDPDGALITPITNGLGAGLDRDRALAHGIGEIIQRHTNGLRFRALDRLSPVIRRGDLPASVGSMLDRFAGLGIEVVLKHAGTEFGVFSCYAVGRPLEGVDGPDEGEEFGQPIRLTACGEAAHPSVEVAMTKAVLEYANSRVRKAFCFGSDPQIREVAPAAYWSGLDPSAAGEPRAVEAMRHWADLTPHQLQQLTAPDVSATVTRGEVAPDPFDAGDGTSALLARLLSGLDGHQISHEVLTSAAQVGPVWVAKTLVLGAEVETLSYGRIGEAGVRRSIEADLDLARIQDRPSDSHRHRVLLTPQAEERLGGPAWFSYDRAAEIVGDRYPLYREPPRHAVSVGGSVDAVGRS